MRTTRTAQRLINPRLPTVTMPSMGHPLIRFLAKIKRGVSSELRFGNRAQAETKRTKLAAEIMQEDSSSAVVQIGSRFLIAVFPQDYELSEKTDGALTLISATPPLQEPLGYATRAPFATVTGPRNQSPQSSHVVKPARFHELSRTLSNGNYVGECRNTTSTLPPSAARYRIEALERTTVTSISRPRFVAEQRIINETESETKQNEDPRTQRNS